MPFSRLPLIALGLAAWLASSAPATETRGEPLSAGWKGLVFRIEDSSCLVGIAPVFLSVSELKPEDGKLVGRYRIRVPLKSSKNDRGRIVLPLDATVDELGENGGTLRGHAYSDKENVPPNEIVCEIVPERDRTIFLAITTDHRTVNFESRYEVVEAGGDGS